jgi:hypothetical protein
MSVNDYGSLERLGAVPDGVFDNSAVFERYLETLIARGGGTIMMPDGIYGISKTLVIPAKIHMQMSPGAVLRALPDFEGDAVLQIGEEQDGAERPMDQYILGGRIDGASQPLIGARVRHGLGVIIENMVVKNALRTGLELGVLHSNEIVLSKVRVVVDRGTQALPDSKGMHFLFAHDSHMRDIVVTGYATAVHCSASSNSFQLVHVWNYDTNVPLKMCFFDEGNNNSYVQCYGDGVSVAPGETGYGWYLNGPHTRLVSCMLFASHWTHADTMIGVYLGDEAKACTFVGNYFMVNRPDIPKGGARPHDMKAAFAGNLESATFVGNTYCKGIREGRIFGPADQAPDLREQIVRRIIREP